MEIMTERIIQNYIGSNELTLSKIKEQIDGDEIREMIEDVTSRLPDEKTAEALHQIREALNRSSVFLPDYILDKDETLYYFLCESGRDEI